MRSCEYYQTQLLDHLYGLLPADESLALIEHAGQCENCRAALLRADGERKLLTAAAKLEFVGLRFQAPEPAVQTVKLRTASPRAAEPASSSWRRWALAAGILLALGGIGYPSARHINNYYGVRDSIDIASNHLEDLRRRERSLIDQHEKQLARAEQDDKTAEAQRLDLVAQQKEKIEAILDSHVVMEIIGPETIRAGEPNVYHITTKNMKGTPVPVRVDFKLSDQATEKVVFEQKQQTSGAHDFEVPPDLTWKAGSNLVLEVVASTDQGHFREVKESLTVAKSAYVTQLVTDKPMYQPGETIRFRSLTMDRASLKPAEEDFRLIFKLQEPNGTEKQLLVQSTRAYSAAEGKNPKLPVRGIGAGEFVLPPGLESGEYLLKVEEAYNRFPAEMRRLIVNRYERPRLNKELKGFNQSTYGPGEEVVAKFQVTRVEGRQPLVRQPVTATLRIDGKLYKANGEPATNDFAAFMRLETDTKGNATVRFRLPEKIDRGDASLTVQFTDVASHESLVRTVPIVLKKLQVEFFPEGGDLVAGVPNRVYFQALTPLDRPADLKGNIVDSAGNVVARTETLNDPMELGINQGMGAFTFTPAAGKQYELKIEAPAGIEGKFTLPAVKKDGVALSIPSGLTKGGEPIDVIACSAGQDRDLLVGAYCRGRLLDIQQVHAKADQPTEVHLKPTADVGGVYRVTVFEKQNQQLQPLAERLVYRQPERRLNLAIEPDKKLCAPGDKVNVSIKARNEAGQPAPAVVLVGVVDQSLLQMADEKTARTMPTHFLLTTEVRRAEDLENADVLLGEHPKAAQALDLLLGTQGWRRFVESDPKRFQKDKEPREREDLRYKADVDRLLIANGHAPAGEDMVVSSLETRLSGVIEEFRPKFDQVQERQEQATAALAAAQKGQDYQQQRESLKEQAETTRTEYLAGIAAFNSLENTNGIIRMAALAVFGLVLLVAGVGSLVIAVARRMPRHMPAYATAIGAVGVCGLLLLVGTVIFDMEQPDMPVAWQPRSATSEVALAKLARAEEKQANKVKAVVAPAGAESGPADKPEGALPVPVPVEPPMDLAKGEAKEAADEKDLSPTKSRRSASVSARSGPEADVYYARRNEMVPLPLRDSADAKAQPYGGGASAPTKAPASAPAPGAAFGGMPGRNAAAANTGAPDAGEGTQRATDRNIQEDALKNLEAYKKIEEQMDRSRREKEEQAQKDKTSKEDKGSKKSKTGGSGKGMPKKAAGISERSASSSSALEKIAASPPPAKLREYAHRRAGTADFAETLYWHPALVMPDGTAQISFEVSDLATVFQIIVAGCTNDGRLGTAAAQIESTKPADSVPRNK